jgi:hypothetical protein
MQPYLPLTGNPATLQRLASLYMAVFWTTFAFFYVSFFSSGYDPYLAVLPATCGAIAFWLLRFKERASGLYLRAEVWPKPGTRNTVLSLESMLETADAQLHAASRGTEVGLMLVTVRAPNRDRPDPLAMTFLQEQLYREARSRVFQAEADTLAVIEAQADLASRLDQLAIRIHTQFRARQVTNPGMEGHHLVVGVAIAGSSKRSSRDLLEGAVAAVKRAELLKKDTFFRQA